MKPTWLSGKSITLSTIVRVFLIYYSSDISKLCLVFLLSTLYGVSTNFWASACWCHRQNEWEFEYLAGSHLESTMFGFWSDRDLCILVRRIICTFFRDLIASPHTSMQHILIVATMHTTVLHVILIGKIRKNAQIMCWYSIIKMGMLPSYGWLVHI